ncbi:intraflagellar transport-associated protein isoform X3 [Equus quagga]|uniref:intraflagellar transport-associated protein isoform X3 n=1 Tax=Equus quagga TaxID=89248 RepID=UPI001EE24783|nr:intraflagellar transport-associated protein isoform X3 [Equus quagga]
MAAKAENWGMGEDNVTKREAFGTDSSENILTSIKFPHENAPNDHHLRNKAIFLRTLSQCSEEEQIVMDEGQKVGSSFQGDLSRAGKVKTCCCFREKWSRMRVPVLPLTSLPWPSLFPLEESPGLPGKEQTSRGKRCSGTKSSPSHLMKNSIMML